MSAPGKAGSKYVHTSQERDNNSHDDVWGVNVVEIVGENASGTALNRVTVDDNGQIVVSAGSTNYTTRIAENSGDANITYIGNAVIGTATSAASWQIKRLDATTGLIKLWSGGTDAFDKVWDDREAGSYS